MLIPGTHLGPYEIQALIGRGGMGDVYRAHDSRLDRTVAVKTLSDALSGDEARQRFEREARTIARLGHPHICAIHDVGRCDDIDFIVFEFLQGETLAQRLQRGPLPLSDALRTAFQIADALQAAHSQQIIHRDLKPGNVMLTRSGAKLLDFGLAKPVALIPAAAGASRLETANAPLTAEGTILGTLQYMAPEQLEGAETDARTDVFAFGALLYEMVAGRPPFSGKTQAGLMAAILEHDPQPIASLQSLVPPLLDRVVRGCLEKNPDERWQSARDVSSALRLVEGPPPGAALEGVPARRRWPLVATVSAIVGLLVGAALAVWWRPAVNVPTAAAPLIRFEIASPATLLAANGVPTFGLSADGSTLVYVGVSEGDRRVYVRRLDDAASVPIAGTEAASSVYVSPDGRSVVFSQGVLLQRVSLDGGAPLTLGFAGFGTLRGLAWGTDDSLVFSRGTDSGLWRLAADSREPSRVTQPDISKGERSHRWPHLLPSGEAVLYTAANSDILSFDEASIMVHHFATGESKEVLRGGSFPVYSTTGHLLYARGGAVLAAPFDLERLAVTGPSVTVLADVVTYPATGAAQYALSNTGVLASISGGGTQPRSSVLVVDREGRGTAIPFPPALYQWLNVHPQGGSIALDVDNANASIWIGDVLRTTARRLTLAWSNNGPMWTPDGTRVAYQSARGGDSNIFWQALDGTAEEQLTTDANDQTAPSFSPDGRYMTFENRIIGAPTRDIHLMDLENGRGASPIINTPFDEFGARFSPDGRWISYLSNESGRTEIYVQSFPDLKRKTLVSGGGGTFAVWSKRTPELFFRQGDAVMAVAVPADSAGQFGPPTVVFKRPSRPQFDTTPEGGFVMIEDPPGTPAMPIQVAINWLNALSARR
jgi:Tol biopolymer transport system component